MCRSPGSRLPEEIYSTSIEHREEARERGGMAMARHTLLAMLAVLALLLVGASTPVAAAPAGKTDICHFDGVTGTWIRISVSAHAVVAHLTHHNDALPGGPTTITGTQLDQNCQPLPACQEGQPLQCLCGDLITGCAASCQPGSCDAVRTLCISLCAPFGGPGIGPGSCAETPCTECAAGSPNFGQLCE